MSFSTEKLSQRLRAAQLSLRHRLLRPLVSDLAWDRLVARPGRVASYSERTATYAALGVLAERHRLRANNLSAAELKVFSQNGEDGVNLAIMECLGVERGHFIEFGIEDGREGNCVLLADVLGWSGLFIEADTVWFEQLAAKYRYNTRIRALRAFVTPDNVNDLFRDEPDDTDILSIDINGQDYWVWEALEVVHPKLVIIEYNSRFGPDDHHVEPLGTPPNYSQTFGASIGALSRLGRSKGYTLVYLELTGANAFFVRDDLLARVPAAVTYRAPNYFLSGVAPSGPPNGA